MVIYTLLLSLLASFTLHIIIIILYIKIKAQRFFWWFIATIVTNLFIAMTLIILSLTKPYLIRALNLQFFFWLLSGFIMTLLLAVKILIFWNIYQRTKDTHWYHINYFGKKVYEKGIVKQTEFLGIFISLPFFLIIGAFFVSRLINFIRFGHI